MYCIVLPQHHYLHLICQPHPYRSPPLTTSSLRPEQPPNTRQPQDQTIQLARDSSTRNDRPSRLHMTSIQDPIRKPFRERRQAVPRLKRGLVVQRHIELERALRRGRHQLLQMVIAREQEEDAFPHFFMARAPPRGFPRTAKFREQTPVRFGSSFGKRGLKVYRVWQRRSSKKVTVDA